MLSPPRRFCPLFRRKSRLQATRKRTPSTGPAPRFAAFRSCWHSWREPSRRRRRLQPPKEQPWKPACRNPPLTTSRSRARARARPSAREESPAFQSYQHPLPRPTGIRQFRPRPRCCRRPRQSVRRWSIHLHPRSRLKTRQHCCPRCLARRSPSQSRIFPPPRPRSCRPPCSRGRRPEMRRRRAWPPRCHRRLRSFRHHPRPLAAPSRVPRPASQL